MILTVIYIISITCTKLITRSLSFFNNQKRSFLQLFHKLGLLKPGSLGALLFSVCPFIKHCLSISIIQLILKSQNIYGWKECSNLNQVCRYRVNIIADCWVNFLFRPFMNSHWSKPIHTSFKTWLWIRIYNDFEPYSRSTNKSR